MFTPCADFHGYMFRAATSRCLPAAFVMLLIRADIFDADAAATLYVIYATYGLPTPCRAATRADDMFHTLLRAIFLPMLIMARCAMSLPFESGRAITACRAHAARAMRAAPALACCLH